MERHEREPLRIARSPGAGIQERSVPPIWVQNGASRGVAVVRGTSAE